MVKKHETKARGWHHPAKVLKKSSPGKCEFCKRKVENIEAHMKQVHKEKV